MMITMAMMLITLRHDAIVDDKDVDDNDIDDSLIVKITAMIMMIMITE